MIDLEYQGDIDLLPSRRCFIIFLVSYEIVDRYIKLIKKKICELSQKCDFFTCADF